MMGRQMKETYAKVSCFIVFFPAFLGILTNLGHCAQDKLSIEEIVQKIAPSVVTIMCFNRAGDSLGDGTGFVIGPSMVITCAHFIKDAYSIAIYHPRFVERIDSRPKILKIDTDVDLAILEALSIDSPPLIMEFDNEVKAGQPVVVIGNQWGGNQLVSEGIVRACGVKRIAFSAPIHSGHSGSPLLDMKGRVIGVCASSSYLSENMAFAVTLPTIEKFMNSEAKPKTLPLAGTSLFWPRLFKRVWTFTSGLFNRIFNAGEWLFFLFLKIASVVVVGILIYRAAQLAPVKAFIAFAIFAIALIFIVSLALFVILDLLVNGLGIRIIINSVILTLLSSAFYFLRRSHRRHRLGKAAKPKSNAPESLIPNEVGIAAK